MEKTADPVDMLVGFSHFEASRALTRHMLSVGYRRIGYLAARLDPRTQRRIQGYQDALREAGCADPKLLTATPASSLRPRGSSRSAGPDASWPASPAPSHNASRVGCPASGTPRQSSYGRMRSGPAPPWNAVPMGGARG